MKSFLLGLLLFFHLESFGQADTTSRVEGYIVASDWKERGLVLGVNFTKFLYGEIGHYRSYVYEVGGFPIESTLINYGAEFSYFDKLIVAPKIQARIHVFIFNASLSSIFYTDITNDYSLKIRPEMGIGLYNLDINYGYNIGILNNEFKQVNKHVICLRYYLNCKKKILHEYDSDGKKYQ
jgi:hypothetical protein